ncbi:MAG: hypothetical protein FWC99_07170 [Coriobacteriia bacterium]|nr:hypothetical protein [Coriobacteriia bacterium]
MGTGPLSAVSAGSVNPPTSSTPLASGEVRVGKSIEYNIDPTLNTPDGTITVTLSAHANTYTNAAGIVSNPLIALPSGAYIEIIDDIGEFAVLGALPSGLTLSGNTIMWAITDQSAITGPTPLEISFTLTVINPPHQPPFLLSYWYSTGAAQALFQPAQGNPYYRTMTETSYDEFFLSMSWNNGNGINSGAIIDNHLGVTIVFPTNNSRENRYPFNPDGSMNLSTGQWNWWPQNINTRNQAATVTTPEGVRHFTWQLHWEKGGTNYNMFTVKDLEGPGLDVQYQIYFDGPGGNEAIPGGRSIVSQQYFTRTFNTEQGDNFMWDGPAISIGLDVVGQIRLTDEYAPSPVFDLVVGKEFGVNDFHLRWGMSNDTEFVAHIKNDTVGFYLTFTYLGSDVSGRIYAYAGLAAEPTPVTFSVNAPATLLEIPTTIVGDQTFLLTEHFTWDPDVLRAPEVNISYRVNGSTPMADMATFAPYAGDDIAVTVINYFSDPAYGAMNVLKLIDGFPADWGINSATEFQFKVWDVQAGNYLLFVDPQLALDDGSTWDNPVWVPGTLFCVGNDGSDAEGIWYFTDAYWYAHYLAGTIEVTPYITIRNLQTIGLSNLWPEVYEIHELDFDGNLLETSSASDWWQVSYIFNGVPSTQGSVPPAGALTAIMTNTFARAEGNLSMFKELSGHPEDWGVDESTLFTILVRDAETASHLLFNPVQLSDGTWQHVGYINEQGIRMPNQSGWYEDNNDLATAIYELAISVNVPLVLSNIDAGSDRRYMIEEIVDGGHVIRFFAEGSELIENGTVGGIEVSPYANLNITIVNHYLSRESGKTIIFKQLDGDYNLFNVDVDTEFGATMINAGTQRTLLFEKNPDVVSDITDPPVTMSSYTHRGEYDQTTNTVYLLVRDASDGTWSFVPSGTLANNPNLITGITFTARKPALLDDLVPGDYRIIETPCLYETFEASVSNAGTVRLQDTDALSVTIVNTFTYNHSVLPTLLHVATSPAVLGMIGIGAVMMALQLRYRKLTSTIPRVTLKG